MPIVVENGIEIGNGITIESGTVVDPNLVLELRAQDYIGSGSTWNARVGSNATLFNNPSHTNITPYYLNFNPNSFQYASVPNLGTLNQWTIDSWFSTNTMNGRVTYIVGNQYNGSSSINFGLGTMNAPTNYNVAVGLFENGWQTTQGLNIGSSSNPFLITGTFDGNTITQYFNGYPYAFNTRNYSGPTFSGGEVRIARRWDGANNDPTNFFQGSISVVRIWNIARSAAAIEATFLAERSAYNV